MKKEKKGNPPAGPGALVWEDASSYSKYDMKREPSVWEAKPGGVRIAVHRHIHHPGEWLLSCKVLDIEHFVLVEKEIEAAKAQALEVVRERIEWRIHLLKGMLKGCKVRKARAK